MAAKRTPPKRTREVAERSRLSRQAVREENAKRKGQDVAVVRVKEQVEGSVTLTGGPDPTRPQLGLLVKIGSALVHAEEYLSPHGHPVDKTAFDELLRQPDVQAWIKAMGPMLPLKRNP